MPSCTLDSFLLAEHCQSIRMLLQRLIDMRGTQVEQRAKQSCTTLLRSTTIFRKLCDSRFVVAAAAYATDVSCSLQVCEVLHGRRRFRADGGEGRLR